MAASGSEICVSFDIGDRFMQHAFDGAMAALVANGFLPRAGLLQAGPKEFMRLVRGERAIVISCVRDGASQVLTIRDGSAGLEP